MITDAGLVHLRAIKTLRTLYIGAPAITEAAVKDLQAALPDLEINPVFFMTALPRGPTSKLTVYGTASAGMIDPAALLADASGPTHPTWYSLSLR